MGLVVNVDERAGLQRAGGNLGGWLTVLVRMDVRRVGGRSGERESNDLAVVLRHLGSRNPSEWSVVPRFPSECSVGSLDRSGVEDLGGVPEAPTLGSIGLRFSRVPPPTFSAAHTDLEYSENHARDVGPPSHCIYVATWSTDFGQK